MKWLFQIGFLTVFPLVTVAQDGQKLFNTNCAACHKVEGKLIGPQLKGVKEKWEKAGEEELLYRWIQNPKSLFDSGESKMASEVWDYDASVMPAQQVSNEEIDAILEYADSDIEVISDIGDPLGETEGEIMGTDYTANAYLFWTMLVLAFVLLLAIIGVSAAIRGLISSPVYLKKLKQKGNITPLLVLAFFLTSGSLFAADGANQEVWMKFENYHLWIMLTVDIMLLGALIYLKNMFSGLVNQVKTEEELKVEESIKKDKSLSKILTGAVDLEDEGSVLMDHDYDGIQELDNDLPPWWVWSFYASILFAVVYMLHYHVFKTGDLQHEEYEKSIVQAEKDVEEYLAANAMNVDENTATLLLDPSDLRTGGGIYAQYCVACHAENGEGGIGPNLTDDYWIYGNDIKDVFKVIKYGAKNGMKSWREELNPIQMQQVASYILHLEFKEGKEPEGDFYGLENDVEVEIESEAFSENKDDAQEDGVVKEE